jgi:hypothetical protein
MVWVGRYSPWAVLSPERLKAEEKQAWKEQKPHLQSIVDDLKEIERRRAENERLEFRRPPIADKPPFPKIFVDRYECDLGVVESEQTVRNTFKITNVGQARLVLVWHPVGCWHRPAPAFPRYQEIKPGNSLDIEITCDLYGEIPNLRKVLSFWTNDPTRPDLDLSIRGTAVEAKR